jgi:uncharacterized protein
MKIIIRLFSALALLGLASMAVPGLTRGYIFMPPKTPLTLTGVPSGARLISVEAADGLKLSGIAVTGQADKPVLLVFHGNASSANGAMNWLTPLITAGYGMVAAEYRGYSANPGKPSQKGLADDADAFLAYAKTLSGSRKVIVIGHSLGGGVALDLSLRHTLDMVITIGTFTSIKDMAPRLARGLISDPFDNMAALQSLNEPLFIIHGTEDDLVPAEHGNRLYHSAAKAGKTGGAIVLSGEGHAPKEEKIQKAIQIAETGNQKQDDPAINFYPFPAAGNTPQGR